jgi:hypothetical protein
LGSSLIPARRARVSYRDERPESARSCLASSATPAPTTWPTGSSVHSKPIKLIALTLDERALRLSALEDPPQELAELRAVLLADHQWKRAERLDCSGRVACSPRDPLQDEQYRGISIVPPGRIERPHAV